MGGTKAGNVGCFRGIIMKANWVLFVFSQITFRGDVGAFAYIYIYLKVSLFSPCLFFFFLKNQY